MTLYCICLVDF